MKHKAVKTNQRQAWQQALLIGVVGLFVGAQGGCGPDGEGNTDPEALSGKIHFKSSLRAYENCNEIQSDVHTILERERSAAAKQFAEWKKLADSGGGPVMSAPQVEDAPSTDAASGDVLTNLQEKGVDEADFTKVGDDQIYVLSGTKIKVVDRATFALEGAISLPDEIQNPQMFVDGERLVVVGTKWEEGDSSGTMRSLSVSMCYDCGGGYNDNQNAIVLIYDIRAGEIPEKIDEFTYNGQLKDYRLTGGKLALVLESNLEMEEGVGQFNQENVEDETPVAPLKIADEKIQKTRCNHVYEAVANDADFRFTRVISRDVQDLDAEEDYTAFVGGADYLYMTPGNLFVAKASYVYGWYNENESEESRQKTAITALGFDRSNGEFLGVNYGTVTGYVKDQWAFKQLNKGDKMYLAVATTQGDSWGAERLSNNMFVLGDGGDGKLEVVSKVTGFGKNEDIRAIRYVGDYGYVVTFEKTDPLFAINLADPTDIKLDGELKVPGFSMYLHPAPGNKLIGVGFEGSDQGGFTLAQGVQISLFDIADPTKLARLDNHVIGERGSFSEVTSDHHGFFFDPETMLASIPIVEIEQEEGSDSWDLNGELKFMGANVYRVGEASLDLITRLTHKELLPDFCDEPEVNGQWWSSKHVSPDIRRTFKIDGQLVTISNFALKVHAISDPENELASVSLPKKISECPTFNQYGDWW